MEQDLLDPGFRMEKQLLAGTDKQLDPGSEHWPLASFSLFAVSSTSPDADVPAAAIPATNTDVWTDGDSTSHALMIESGEYE